MAGPLTPLIPFLPAIGKGLFWTGTAAGTAAGAYGLLGIPEDMRNDIIRQEPDDVTGKYKLNPFQKLLLDEDSLIDSRNKYVMDTAKKDARVLDAQGLNKSLQLTNEMTADDFVKKYSTQIRADKLNQTINERKLISKAAYDDPARKDEREKESQARRDRLKELSAGRADIDRRYLHQTTTDNARRAHEAQENKLMRRQQSELAENSNNLTMQMSLMQNDLSEKRMDYDRETRRLDKRSAAIAQLMSGLGALGGAFAV